MTTRKKTARAKGAMNEAALKKALLDAALAHVPFDGFSRKALERAAADLGVEPTEIAKIFPSGGPSLVEAYSEAADGEMEAGLGRVDLKSIKVRERIAAAVRLRLAALKPHKEAARRAAAFLSLPPNLGLATRLVYRTVDSMWRAVGDTSTDFNFYTKRAILAGVWSSTLMRWFNDTSDGESETETFLAARIENVMQFEQLRSQIRDAFSRVPSPLTIFNDLATRR